jgi:Kef-type K+ transport system membrane component KefB
VSGGVTLVGAATGVADVLFGLFLVLVAAKAGAELFKWLHQPTLVGEILAGVVIGPSVLGIVEATEVLEVFAELGVVFILFWVGLETRIGELLQVGRTAASVGVLGVVIPLAAGVGLGLAYGESAEASVFLGAALVATSVGITSAVLVGIGQLRTRPGRTILGAAVVDDILAMLIVAVATGFAASESGSVDVNELLVIAGMAIGFVAFFALGGTRFMRRFPHVLKAPRFSESPLLPAVILCLGLAALAAEIGLAAIIGAFLAGLMVAETTEQHPIEEEVAPLYAFFAPFFFAAIGIQIDLGALADGDAPALLGVVTVVAVLTKLGGAWLGARSLGRDEALFVGVGMVPRGEVGIIVASIGLGAGVLADELFAVVVAMSVITTLAVPPVLRVVGGRLPAQPS